VRVGIVGIDFQRPAIAVFGLLRLTLGLQYVAEVAVKIGPRTVQTYGLADHRRSGLRVPALKRDHPTKMQGLAIRRVCVQNSSITGLGGVKVSFLVVLPALA